MDKMVTDYVASSSLVNFTWTLPSIGSGNIDYFNILFYNKSSSSYVSQTLCNGSDPTIVAQLWCEVQMDDIVAFSSYSLGDTILAEIQAHNPSGLGDFSDPNDGNAVAKSAPIVEPSFASSSSS